MTDEPIDDELAADQLEALGALLSREELWGDVDPSGEDALLAAIAAERHTAPAPEPPPSTAPSDAEPARTAVVDARHRFGAVHLAGAAAAAAVVVLALVIGIGALGSTDGDAGPQFALEATDLAPGAVADAVVDEQAAGTRIVLSVTGLAPAADGTYYEAWLRKDAEVGVSAGTFHVRGGDAEIELWAGVSPGDYPLLTVTIQTEGDGAESSGRVVFHTSLDG